jgi:hypothetical protein
MYPRGERSKRGVPVYSSNLVLREKLGGENINVVVVSQDAQWEKIKVPGAILWAGRECRVDKSIREWGRTA